MIRVRPGLGVRDLGVSAHTPPRWTSQPASPPRHLVQMHAEPAVAMARRGYHILLEKPMAGTISTASASVSTRALHLPGACAPRFVITSLDPPPPPNRSPAAHCMSTVSEEDCERIAAACEENKVMLCVCHVLRYSPVNRKVRCAAVRGQQLPCSLWPHRFLLNASLAMRVNTQLKELVDSGVIGRLVNLTHTEPVRLPSHRHSDVAETHS